MPLPDVCWLVISLLTVLPAAPVVRASFSAADKNAFVVVHNRLRETAYPTAAAMRFVTWSNKLEALAVAAAEKCSDDHNYGGEYKDLGENIYTGYRTDPAQITLGFFAEKSVYDHQKRVCNGVCGHYTAVMADRVTEFGCGIKRNCEPNKNIVFCEYSYNAGGALFNYGPQCSECPADMPLCLNGLCISSAIAASAVAKEVDTTASASAAKCRLACRNCGTRVTDSGNCKCNCGTEATGDFCETKKPGSTATCSACFETPACLNNGDEDKASPSCKCNCKSGFAGERCEISKDFMANSVRLVISAASEFKFVSYVVMPPVSKSLFNSKIWTALQTELAAAVNEFCRADAASYAKCCPGKTFPSASSVSSAVHVGASDFQFIESMVGNTLDGSLGVPVYAAVSSSSALCSAGTGTGTAAGAVPQSVLMSSVQPKIAAISAKLTACCENVVLKAVTDPSASGPSASGPSASGPSASGPSATGGAEPPTASKQCLLLLLLPLLLQQLLLCC